MSKASDLVFDCYLPGTLVPPQSATVTGGDFTTTTKAAAVEVTGLSISYTPPVNCWAFMFCRMRLQCNTALVRASGSIYIDGAITATQAVFLHDAATNLDSLSMCMVELTAGITYTVTGQCRQDDLGGAQTLRVESDSQYTKLFIIPLNRP